MKFEGIKKIIDEYAEINTMLEKETGRTLEDDKIYLDAARAELAIISDENMVLVDRGKLKEIEWAGESEPDMCGDTVSVCPVCKTHWNDKGEHKDGCWLAMLIKDLYVPPRYWKPKKEGE